MNIFPLNFTVQLKRVLHYFETGDLVPFLVVVSMAHFVGALANRDLLPVAIAVGVAVDVGMYRVIKSALKYGRWWWAAAIMVTGMSFGYHLEYYGLSPQGILFAAPLPMLIILLAALSYQERWSAKLARGTDMARLDNPIANRGAEDTRTNPANDTRGTYLQFKVAQLARNGSGPMSANDVVTQFHVPKRTAYRWLAQYRHETEQFHTEVN